MRINWLQMGLRSHGRKCCRKQSFRQHLYLPIVVLFVLISLCYISYGVIKAYKTLMADLAELADLKKPHPIVTQIWLASSRALASLGITLTAQSKCLNTVVYRMRPFARLLLYTLALTLFWCAKFRQTSSPGGEFNLEWSIKAAVLIRRIEYDISRYSEVIMPGSRTRNLHL